MISKSFPNVKGTIFIVTYGRSGSTVLQSLLQSIPGAHITGENNLALEGLFQASRSTRKARQVWGKKPQPPTHPWYGADKLKPNRFEARLAEVFVQEVIQPPNDTRWIGFKEVRYPRLGTNFPAFLNFCQRAFPNAFFVFNSRNGEDVSKSKWWANKPKAEVLQLVEDMDARFAEFTAANPSCSHHVYYEKTCADVASLQPLFDKLGEPLDLGVARKVLATPLTH
ncbi:sulfotransferase [Salipiger sp. CCB-MM3]|uniref:sulfotransferase n=1 Tax=Salipiger sp. CCB-MM3 TaxID=1792508 RepID=UPI00187D9E8E|nr:sulfotransferase [Salipiger sp. CCB-MM3]